MIYVKSRVVRVKKISDSVQITTCTTRFVLYLKILIDTIKIFDSFFEKEKKKVKREKRKKPPAYLMGTT